MGIEFDSTFIFQVINTVALILLIVGVIFLVRKIFNNKKKLLESQKRIENKLDILLDREK